MAEVVTWLFAVVAALLVGAVLVYIGGFILTMVAALIYLPIEAGVEVAHDLRRHLPHHGRHVKAV